MTVIQLQERELLAGTRETRARRADFEVREKPDGTGGTTLEFNGYACVTDVAYEMYDMFGEYEEVVDSGSFKKTLSEGCDTVYLVNHEGMTLARTKPGTLRLLEDETGLHTSADLSAQSPTVQDLRIAIDRGDIDEMSFAFRVTRQQWSPDYMQRNIQEVSLQKGDVSVVNYGANPYTSEPGMSLRSINAMRAMRATGGDQFIEALREVRAGQAISASSMSVLKHVLSLASTADNAVDELQVVLSELMGVPNLDSETNVTEGEENSSNLSTYTARAKALGYRTAP